MIRKSSLIITLLIVGMFVSISTSSMEITKNTKELQVFKIEKKVNSDPIQVNYINYAFISTSDDFKANGFVKLKFFINTNLTGRINTGLTFSFFVSKIITGKLYLESPIRGTIEVDSGSSVSPSIFLGSVTGEKNSLVWTLSDIKGYGFFITYS